MRSITTFIWLCCALAALMAVAKPTRSNSGGNGTNQSGENKDSAIVRVEYLESNGEQYIDTGFLANRFLNITIDAQLIPPLMPKGWFGAMGSTSSSRHRFVSNSSGYGYSIGGKDGIIAGFDPTVRFRLTYNRQTAICSVEGVGSQSYAWNFGDATSHYTIFAYNENGTIHGGAWRVFSFQCEDTATGMSLHLVPVRKGQIGMMLDEASGLLFENQGSGQFVVGPDKK